MKRMLLAILPALAASAGFVLILGVATAGQNIPAPSATVSGTQDVPRPARAPQPPPLTGPMTRATLESFGEWKDLRAQDYEPDAASVSAIRDSLRDVDVLVFVATWCPDSRREVPRFLKILDQAGFAGSRLTLYGLDRTKRDAEGLTVKWQIERVPTFILIRGGREIGRIVERPATTLEAAMTVILR